MAQPTSSLLTELDQHLSALEQDPSLEFDQKLFVDSNHILAGQVVQNPQQLLRLIPRLTRVLLLAQHDPAPVVGLLSRLVEPLSFSDITSFQPPIDFVGGLNPQASQFNSLVLDLVGKAAESPKDAAVLAGQSNVIAALVKLWLSTQDLGIAEKTLSALIQLLEIDREKAGVPVHGVGSVAEHSGGQGLVWRRLFGDKDVYELIFSLTSLSDIASKELSRREKTVAQARLFSLIPSLGLMDWNYLVRSHHAGVESRYGLKADEGLLHYASLYMVDYKNDVLLHMNLLQFFADLISTVTTPSSSRQHTSHSLDFLEAHGLHERAISFWLDPDDPSHDPVDQSFLHGPSANYTAVFSSQYTDALVASHTLPAIMQRLSKALHLSANQWGYGESPKHDLSVLSALPRSALLPQPTLGTGRRSSPLFQIPTKTTNEDALHTLSKVLGGPRTGDDTPETRLVQERQTAPLVFHIYHHYHPSLFSNLITHADTVALPGNALASLTLLSSIVSAKWEAGSPLTSAAVEHFSQGSSPMVIPISSIPVLLRLPARDAFLPYILRAPRTFSNLVGGRGDAESAAYKIAMAKWDCLLLFQRRLNAWVPGEGGVSAEELGLAAVKAAVTARVAEGVWGDGGQQVGGRIATLEL